MAELDRLIQEEKMEMYSRNVYTDYIRPVIAEFVGVCLFVFVGVLSANGAGGNIVAVALAHGLTIALLIMGLGAISGGHFNPAVTLGVAITGNMKLILAVAYLFAQIIGGMLGAAFVRAILPSTEYKKISGGAQVLQGTGVEPGWAILCEGILTFILVFTVLMNAVDVKTKNNLAPLAIGFAVAVDILAGGAVTGASMNPARTFGPAVVASPLVDGLWSYHYVYWVGPLAGAFIAGLFYRFMIFILVQLVTFITYETYPDFSSMAFLRATNALKKDLLITVLQSKYEKWVNHLSKS